MKITLHNTSRVSSIEMAPGVSVPARLWEGHTEKGVKILALITRITPLSEDEHILKMFEDELKEVRSPSAIAEEVIPLRMIL